LPSLDTPRLTEVVARLAALLGPHTGDVQQLERGVTNRSFKVVFGGSDYIVQLSGARSEELGIDRETECIANTIAGELGIAPPVATMLHDPHCLVTRFVEGRQPSREELRGELLPHVARALRTFHRSGVVLPSGFDPYRTVERYAEIARGAGKPLPHYDAALAHAHAIERALADHADHRAVPCHNDLLTDNIIQADARLLLADWEYAGVGDPFFDLGSFSANNELDDDAEERLLAEYFGEPPTPRRRAALKLMRFMSDFREAMWGEAQLVISELDRDFRGYADRHIRRVQETGDDPGFRSSLEAAGGP
jgi:thiamine kinase-like enzyme